MASFPDVKPDLEEQTKVLLETLRSMQQPKQLEIERLKEEKYSMAKQLSLEKSQKKKAEAKLEKLMAENEGLTDQNISLVGEKSVMTTRRMNLEDRERGLLDELKKVQELCACAELANRNLKLEGELTVWKQRFTELEGRITELQRVALSLANKAGVSLDNLSNGLNLDNLSNHPTSGVLLPAFKSPNTDVINLDSDEDEYPASYTPCGNLTFESKVDGTLSSETSGTSVLKRKLDLGEKSTVTKNYENSTKVYGRHVQKEKGTSDDSSQSN
ncbi:hypothetical protein ACFE04_014793 [Oxalis oulophora]